MIIHNKLESINLIRKLQLNSFPERLFSQGDIIAVGKFLEEYPADFYAIRSKEIVGCRNNNFKVPKDKVLDEIKNFNLFTINVSSYNYVSNFILIGDIRISSKNDVWFIGSSNLNYTGRMAEHNPDFNYATDIFDKNLNEIPSFDLIYGYIIDHDLLDVIIEFAIYDKPVGIYQNQIVIFEIRTEF